MAFFLCRDYSDYANCGASDVLPSWWIEPILLLRNGTIVNCLNTVIEPDMAVLVEVLRFVMRDVCCAFAVVGFGNQFIGLSLSQNCISAI